MVCFKIRIAQITIEISALYNSTKEFCSSYLSTADKDFSVNISPEDIENERERSYSADVLEGRKPIRFSNEYLETLAVYRKIAEKLPFYNAFLFHGSAVAVDNKAYVFTAKSGTGKSTHVSFYQKEFGKRAVIINDDKPIIRMINGNFVVCGTPWSGKHGLNTNIAAPLKAICVLNRGESNSIQRISAEAALEDIVSQSYRPSESVSLAKFLDILSELSSKITYYKLICNKEPEAAVVSFEGMKE